MAIPLPEQLRPQVFQDFLGQKHLYSQVAALLKAKKIPSLLLFGPPGCGKSTLALLLAKASEKRFIRLSAPECGLQQLRKQLSGVEILILDEIHRFSKAQQDFFLPLLESGELIMIATTTENPSFCVTRQLLSRLHVLRLNPLDSESIFTLAQSGAKKLGKDFDDDLLHFISSMANGDARSLLNLLEYVSNLPKEQQNIADLKKIMPEILARHDKHGDSHYELASAMIKSIRGSNPDAALYYMGCLLEGGEDPRFICRRLILSASEDIGLADPQALTLAVSCQQAVEFVGMPEGFIPLAETVVYLALAPKSNSTYMAYHYVANEIKKHGIKPVPIHLRNAVTTMQKEWGFGKNYQYPHNFPGSWVRQEYMPEGLQDLHFYKAKDQGAEIRLNSWLRNKKN